MLDLKLPRSESFQLLNRIESLNASAGQPSIVAFTAAGAKLTQKQERQYHELAGKLRMVSPMAVPSRADRP